MAIERERFEGSWSYFVFATCVGLLLALLGYLEKGVDRYFVEGSVILVCVLLYIYYTKINTYLEIRDKRTLINKGYRSFGHDEMDIYNIKYIYRLPYFYLRSWGSLMMIFATDENGVLWQTSARETNYTGATIRRFLTRIKQLNPSIELDETYVDLLAGKIETHNLKGTPAKHTGRDVENIFRAKGEKWRTAGMIGKIFNER